jgi:Ser/Thr protein kinase RdoA (MazF antagonist)
VRSWLEVVLAEHYGVHRFEAARLEGGHTNETYAIEAIRPAALDAEPARWVLRRSWAGKPDAQLAREETVLAGLAGPAAHAALVGLELPRLVPTREGAPRAQSEGRAVHVFARCHGEPGPRWLAPHETARARAAMHALARLHGALHGAQHVAQHGALHGALATPPVTPPATLPAATPDGAAGLRARLERVRSRGTRGLPTRITARALDAVLVRIEAGLDEAFADAALRGEPLQWLHGDYHLGNLRWRGSEVASVVDFDDTERGVAKLEAALALFALARQDAGEEAFVYDRALWGEGLGAYEAGTSSRTGLRPEPFERVFCGAQALIHLEAAQRGLWTLQDGIGFWPCWSALSDPGPRDT